MQCLLQNQYFQKPFSKSTDRHLSSSISSVAQMCIFRDPSDSYLLVVNEKFVSNGQIKKCPYRDTNRTNIHVHQTQWVVYLYI